MTEHGYEKGRLDLPFVGHRTFAKQPAGLDWDRIDAEVTVLGAVLPGRADGGTRRPAPSGRGLTREGG